MEAGRPRSRCWHVRLYIWWEPASQFINDHLFAVSSCGGPRELPWTSFIGAAIPFMRARLHDLITSQRPHPLTAQNGNWVSLGTFPQLSRSREFLRNLLEVEMAQSREYPQLFPSWCFSIWLLQKTYMYGNGFFSSSQTLLWICLVKAGTNVGFLEQWSRIIPTFKKVGNLYAFWETQILSL